MFLEHFRGPRGVPEASWRGLGASWEALGGVLGPLGPVLGDLGASWWRREASWRRLGPSWADLGRALGRHGWILGRPGGVQGALPGPRGGPRYITHALTAVPGTRRELHFRPLGAQNAVLLVKIGPSEKLLFLTPPN